MTITKLIGNERREENDLVKKAMENKTIKDVLDGTNSTYLKFNADFDNLRLKKCKKAIELITATANVSGSVTYDYATNLLKDNKQSEINTHFTLENALYSINLLHTDDTMKKVDAFTYIKGIEEKIGFDKKTGLAFDFYCDDSKQKAQGELRISDSAILAVAYFGLAKTFKGMNEKGMDLYFNIEKNMKLLKTENGLLTLDTSVGGIFEDIEATSLYLSLAYVCMNCKKTASELFKGAKYSFGFDDAHTSRIIITKGQQDAFFTALFALTSFVHDDPDGYTFLSALETDFPYSKDKISGFEYLNVKNNFNSTNFLAALAYLAKEGYEQK
jgi:hypothetical protein